jgi:hypothetical protein
MIYVQDLTKSLSPSDQEELGNHVVLACYSTPVERRWLKHITVRNDGANDIAGYWSVSVTTDNATRIVRDISAFIVLNRYYLKDLDDLKDTLSHEYGHHVTLSYLMASRNFADSMHALKQERAPIDYYRARNIENAYASIDPSYKNGWNNCDKEILAEDYRVLFTSSKSPHRMASKHQPPSEMVRDWIWHLFHPHHLGGGWQF